MPQLIMIRISFMLRRTITLPFVLLLAALFNALAGTAVHEARHIHEAVEAARHAAAATAATAVTADAHSLEDARSGTEPSDEEGFEHATCVWCLTHAQDAGLQRATAAMAPPPGPQAALRPRRADTLTAQQMRWPFAARAPPPHARA